MNKPINYIVKSAIKYPDGSVVTARRHFQIIAQQAKLGIHSRGPDCIQGFIDIKGNFYTREEARKLAIKSNQIPETHKGTLYSEDLWPSPLILN